MPGYDTKNKDDNEKGIIGLHQNLKVLILILGTMNRVKRQPTEWDRIFTNHVSDNGLLSRLYKVLLQLNNSKSQSDLKMDKRLE